MMTQITMTLNGARFGRSLIVDHGNQQLEIERFRRKAVEEALSRGLIAPGQDDDVDVVLVPLSDGGPRKRALHAYIFRPVKEVGDDGRLRESGRGADVSRPAGGARLARRLHAAGGWR